MRALGMIPLVTLDQNDGFESIRVIQRKLNLIWNRVNESMIATTGNYIDI